MTLATIFYIIPTLICWVWLYNVWLKLDNRNGIEVGLFVIWIILSILPVTNILLSFIISVIYILRKNE